MKESVAITAQPAAPERVIAGDAFRAAETWAASGAEQPITVADSGGAGALLIILFAVFLMILLVWYFQPAPPMVVTPELEVVPPQVEQ